MQRSLTAAEIAALRAHPAVARPPVALGNTVLGLVKVMLWLELLFGLPMVLLFFAAAHWGHGEDPATALGHAAVALLAPPGLLAALAIGTTLARFTHPAQDWRAQVLADIKLGMCTVTTHRPLAAHPVLDGDNTTPHMLLRLAGDRWLCLSDVDWPTALPGFAPTDTLAICTLPKTKFLVSLHFTGQRIPVLAIVQTDYLWRNDDLPFDQPFGKRGLPEALRRQLYPA